MVLHATVSEGLAQGPYVAARVGFEPATLRMQGTELNTEPHCPTCWRFGRVDTFRPKGHGFDSRSSRHVGTLSKSFTHICLWRFGVKFRHSIRAVSGASSRGLEEAL